MPVKNKDNVVIEKVLKPCTKVLRIYPAEKPRQATNNKLSFMSISIYQTGAEIKNNLVKLLKKLKLSKELQYEILMKKKPVYYPKLEPHPQVLVALGLINLKPIPIKLVTKSMIVPSRCIADIGSR